MLRADGAVPETPGLLDGEFHDPFGAWRLRHLLPRRQMRAGHDNLVNFPLHLARIDIETVKNLGGQFVLVRENGDEDVLGANILVVIAARDFISSLQRFARAVGEWFIHCSYSSREPSKLLRPICFRTSFFKSA